MPLAVIALNDFKYTANKGYIGAMPFNTLCFGVRFSLPAIMNPKARKTQSKRIDPLQSIIIIDSLSSYP